MNRTLPPITEPVTRAELWNIFLRELYSVKDILTEDDIRAMLQSVGVDYDKAAAEAAQMTDEDILRLIQC